MNDEGDTDPEYPLIAVREALLNALVHRDYSIDAPILLSIYHDKLTISSPGGMGGTYSQEDMKAGVNLPTNPHLMGIFRLLGYTESYGTGISRIMRQYRNRDQPVIRAGNSVFMVILPSRMPKTLKIEALLNYERCMVLSNLEASGYTWMDAMHLLNVLLRIGKVEKVVGSCPVRYMVVK